jgi:hypothetical protein
MKDLLEMTPVLPPNKNNDVSLTITRQVCPTAKGSEVNGSKEDPSLVLKTLSVYVESTCPPAITVRVYCVQLL